MSTVLSRIAARLPVLLITGLVVAGGAAMPAVAHAQPPPGSVVPDQSDGDVTTTITGVTDGPCTEPGTPDAPMDGYNAVLSGPGIFAPNATEGAPDGVIVVSTDNVGLSTTGPFPFTFRAPLVEMATDLQSPLLPGEYVLTFRCVNQLFGSVYQTFTATFQLSGGPPATTFTVTDPPPTEPVTAGAPSPAPVASAPESSGGSGPDVAVLGALGVLGIAVLGAVGYLVLRRRQRSTRT